MYYFFDTMESIPEGMGFSLFGILHIFWIAAAFIIILVNLLGYRSLNATRKCNWRKVIASLLIADELFKVAILIYSGHYGFDYLPFHLCSINILLIAIHAYKPFRVLDNFLYTVCIPGALAALLFPSWTSLPLINGMHLHSFTVHILLLLYPTVLTLAGDIKPDVKQLPKSLGLLVLMAIPVYGLNLLLDTNFMFLMSADPGNPLCFFESMWGNHLYGYPVIIICVLLVMYGPVVIGSKLYKKEP